MPKQIAQPIVSAPPSDHVVRAPMLLAGAGLVLGFAVQFLFFDRPLGISFPIMTALFAVAVFLSARWERRQPSSLSYGLAAAAISFSVIAAVRLEPLTVFLGILATFGLLILLARTLLPGRLLSFGWLDLAWAHIVIPLEAWLKPWAVLRMGSERLLGERVARSRAMAVGRGILLALPVVAVFTVFLSAADLIFADYVESVLRWLNLERILEILQRTAVLLLSMLFLLGVIVVALRQRADRPLLGETKPFVEPFVGFAEAAVVLVSVDLLFAAFVVVQFTYLFGGPENIVNAGYTYSDYARRGFGELVAVATLSLAMIVALAGWAQRHGRSRRLAFQGASAALVLLVGVMLASAFVRLQLYEQAYGFTRLRTYTHAAILWMGVLFAAFLALLFAERLRGFAVAFVAACLGFSATLAAVNVDEFIVRHNVERQAAGEELDLPYLFQLTDDAIPELVALARQGGQASGELLARLACRRERLARHASLAEWPAYHAARQRAWQALESIADDLAPHTVRKPHPDPLTWKIVIDDSLVGCWW